MPPLAEQLHYCPGPITSEGSAASGSFKLSDAWNSDKKIEGRESFEDSESKPIDCCCCILISEIGLAHIWLGQVWGSNRLNVRSHNSCCISLYTGPGLAPGYLCCFHRWLPRPELSWPRQFPGRCWQQCRARLSFLLRMSSFLLRLITWLCLDISCLHILLYFVNVFYILFSQITYNKIIYTDTFVICQWKGNRDRYGRC